MEDETEIGMNYNERVVRIIEAATRATIAAMWSGTVATIAYFYFAGQL